MFGFVTFSSLPFSSVISNKIHRAEATILGEANVIAIGNIIGSGWVHQNPEGDSWDMTQSSDWDKVEDTNTGNWVRQNPEGEEWDINKSSDWNKIN